MIEVANHPFLDLESHVFDIQPLCLILPFAFSLIVLLQYPQGVVVIVTVKLLFRVSWRGGLDEVEVLSLALDVLLELVVDLCFLVTCDLQCQEGYDELPPS